MDLFLLITPDPHIVCVSVFYYSTPHCTLHTHMPHTHMVLPCILLCMWSDSIPVLDIYLIVYWSLSGGLLFVVFPTLIPFVARDSFISGYYVYTLHAFHTPHTCTPMPHTHLFYTHLGPFIFSQHIHTLIHIQFWTTDYTFGCVVCMVNRYCILPNSGIWNLNIQHD